ncbi:hypothetical protein PCANC_09306 [Puccinia coronata f. sp. avenae]|uniref:Uncharacterized protein n=1 Tax=Puccinia coronata f. sp. avenae TaxID=200324 RepID=A0A2N5T5I4_9BASI|nr:hypothetical protein PCANC_09306 [Puccinia coronata f. sp. avenae]
MVVNRQFSNCCEGNRQSRGHWLCWHWVNGAWLGPSARKTEADALRKNSRAEVRIQSDAGTRGAGFVEYTTGSESNRMLLRFPTQESLSEGKESSPTSAPVGSPISANKKESKVVCGMPHLHPQLIFHQAHFSTADPHSISSMSKMLGPENRHQKSIRLVLRAQKRLD